MVRVWAFIVEPLRQANDEQRERLGSEQAANLDRETTTVLLVAAVTLTLQFYFVTSRDLVPPDWFVDEANFRIARGITWGMAHVVLYLVFPELFTWFVIGKRLSDYGMKLRGVFAYWWVYAGMYVCMLPVIFIASQRPSFQHTYPFYKLAAGEPLWPRFFIWELFYAAQFIALEFFFRGFLLHGTKRRFGAYSILVMTVPYCMIHFQKPLPETLGAIVAGVVLGFMSLKTRSIWMGAALHIAIAWTMDMMAVATR